MHIGPLEDDEHWWRQRNDSWVLLAECKIEFSLWTLAPVLMVLNNLKKRILSRVVVAHAFSPSTWEAETGRFLSLRPARSTKWVPGQPGLYRETLSQNKTKQNKTKQNKTKHKQKNLIIFLTSYSCSRLRFIKTYLRFLKHWNLLFSPQNKGRREERLIRNHRCGPVQK